VEGHSRVFFLYELFSFLVNFGIYVYDLFSLTVINCDVIILIKYKKYFFCLLYAVNTLTCF